MKKKLKKRNYKKRKIATTNPVLVVIKIEKKCKSKGEKKNAKRVKEREREREEREGRVKEHVCPGKVVYNFVFTKL